MLNVAEDGVFRDQIRADAYTKLLTITGDVDSGVENVLTVTLKDGGDGFLDSGILIREGAFKNPAAELLQLTGTPGHDVLKGTGAAEEVHPGGGDDYVTLGDGADLINFDDITGSRDVLTIADFTLGEDRLDLAGAVLETVRSTAHQTVLDLEGPDNDLIVQLGVTSFDHNMILT